MSGTPVTFGPFRGLSLRHAGFQSIFGFEFFGEAILFFPDFPSSTSRGLCFKSAVLHRSVSVIVYAESEESIS